MIIERVERLAHFEHHKVGDVHHVVDAADADFLEVLLEPIGAGSHFDAPHDARGVTRAQFGIFQPHVHLRLHRGRARLVQAGGHGGPFERIAAQRAQFAGDADDAV